MRSHLPAAALALMLVILAAPAQLATAEPARSPVDLPIYTSDGKAIGRVIATGFDDDNQPVLVAEIDRPLGLGPQAVAIPTDLFVRRAARIELTITEAEVTARLRRGKRKR